MRELNEHKINPGNDTLKITVLDEPGHGGANHAYDIEGGEAVPTHLRFSERPDQCRRKRREWHYARGAACGAV